MMKYLLIFMPLLFLACNGDSNKLISNTDTTGSTGQINTNQVVNVDSFKIESFTQIPSAIDGCSGLFSLSNDAGEKDYVFAYNLQNKAFIRVNGELIELRMVEKNNVGAEIHEKFSGGGYEVELNASESVRKGDELWMYKGDLVISRSGKFRSYKVVGEVGC